METRWDLVEIQMDLDVPSIDLLQRLGDIFLDSSSKRT